MPTGCISEHIVAFDACDSCDAFDACDPCNPSDIAMESSLGTDAFSASCGGRVHASEEDDNDEDERDAGILDVHKAAITF